MRIISSRRPASSLNEEDEVMLKTRRNPWPVFMYRSLMATGPSSVRGCETSCWATKDLPNCSVPAVSRLEAESVSAAREAS